MTMLKAEQIPSNVADRLEFELERRAPHEALAIALSVWPGFRLVPEWDFMTHEKTTRFQAPLASMAKIR